MRKLLSKVFFLAVLTAVMLTITAAASEIGTGVVTGDSLRLRSEPSTGAATIVYLSEGTTVKVLEKLDGWYKVSWNDQTGYVSAGYLAFTPAEKNEIVDLTGKTGVIAGSEVNFRSGPSTDYEVLAVLDKDAQVSLLSLEDGWCKASYDGQEGYVSADYVMVNGIPLADPRGVVTGDCVNVRTAPGTDSNVVDKVYAGDIVDLVSLKDGWYEVSVNGAKGYISSDYVRLYTAGGDSSLGQSVVDKAKEFLGTRYVYGGSSSKGFDCSGFTMYIYDLFGYSLPHSATSQWNSVDTSVARADLCAGDLVFFCDPSRSNGKACSHVGIYIGDGDFIHASSGRSGVVINSLSDTYYAAYYKGARRVG